MDQVYKCEDHPNEDLEVVCFECKALVCIRCAVFRHKEHDYKEISKIAKEKRTKLNRDIEHCGKRIGDLKSEWSVVRLLLETFEESEQKTIETIKARAKTLINKVEERATVKVQQVKDFADQNGRSDLCNGLQEIQNEFQRVKSEKQMKEQELATESDHELIRSSLQQSTCDKSDAVVLMASPDYDSKIFLPKRASDISDWTKCIDKFLGFPKLAQISKSSRTSIVHMMSCQIRPGTQIQALHVLNDGRVCVAFTDDRSLLARKENPITVHLYDDSQHCLWKEDVDAKRVRLFSTYRNITVLCTVTGKMSCFHIDSPSVESAHTITSEEGAYHFKITSSDMNKFRQKSLRLVEPAYHKLYAASCNSFLFRIQIVNPQTVVADSTGKYFAVIHQCTHHDTEQSGLRESLQVPAKTKSTEEKTSQKESGQTSTRTSVAIFEYPKEKKIKTPLMPFRRIGEDWRHFQPADICFYKNNGKNFLFIAEKAPFIFLVDYINNHDLIPLLRYGGVPLLSTPTALTVDHDNHLWIACKGGRILKVLPTKELTDSNSSCVTEKQQEPEPEPRPKSASDPEVKMTYNKAFQSSGSLSGKTEVEAPEFEAHEHEPEESTYKMAGNACSQPEDNDSAQSQSGHIAVALFDYHAEADDEITIGVDDIIADIVITDSDWWSGTCNGRKGLFPADYVELLQ